MNLSRDKNILIVGLGLLGGSYAMALSRKDYRVRAIGKSQEGIDYALERGFIERGTPIEITSVQGTRIVVRPIQ